MHVAPTVHCPVLCNCRSVMSQLTVCNTAARLPNATVSPLVLSTLCRLLCVALGWHARVGAGFFLPCSHAADGGCRGLRGSNAASLCRLLVHTDLSEL